MLKYKDGEYIEMSVEELEQAQMEEAPELTTITLTPEQLELLQKILGGQI